MIRVRQGREVWECTPRDRWRLRNEGRKWGSEEGEGEGESESEGCGGGFREVLRSMRLCDPGK